MMGEEWQRAALFAGLDEGARRELAPYWQRKSYPAGAMILLEGEPRREVYAVARGVVRLRQSSREGREHILGYLGPGSLFNLLPALDGGAAPVTVEAASPVVAYALPGERLLALLRERPQLALALAQHLAGEVRRLQTMVKELALHPVRVRLARFLLQHAESNPPQQRWTQEDLAAQIGTVRDVVGRALRAFAEEGLIRRERGRIVVVNRQALEREAQGE
jgi:CRP/FNR family cyclic AMP-dependent transcriptional regulator